LSTRGKADPREKKGLGEIHLDGNVRATLENTRKTFGCKTLSSGAGAIKKNWGPGGALRGKTK